MRKIGLLLAAVTFCACGASSNAPAPSAGAALGSGFVYAMEGGLDAARTPSIDVADESRTVMRARLGTLGLDPSHHDFQILSSHAGVDGVSHVRLQQYAHGVRVWGADVVVHSDATRFTGVGGNVLAVDGLDVKATVAARSAVDTAKAHYARSAAPGAELAYARETQELVIFPTDDGAVHLAWHVAFFTDNQAGIQPGLWSTFVDAHDGTIVAHWNGIRPLALRGREPSSEETSMARSSLDLPSIGEDMQVMAAPLQASGPGGNARVIRTWKKKLDVTATQVTPAGTTYAMSTPQLQTASMNGGTSGNGIVFTSTTLNFTDKAANDAHGFAEVSLKVLKNWFGYNSLDNNGLKILSRVHYDTQFENAFWDGESMVYGDGGTTFYAMTGALDVTAHELNSGFTSFHSNLNYTGHPGAMNLSFSAIAGTAAEFYFDPAHANFTIGEDLFKTAGAVVTHMCTPTADDGAIDNLANYNAGLDVHYTQGIMNKAFCRAAKRMSGANPDTGNATAAGVRRAAKAWYLANASYWTSGSTFTQGCKGVVDAAKALHYSAADQETLLTSWQDVGVNCRP